MDHAESQALVERLIEEEKLRATVRDKLAADNPPKKTWLSENVKWIMVTLFVPALTWVIGAFLQERERIQVEAAKEIERTNLIIEAARQDARNDVAAMTALLPALADPDPKKSGLAIIVLTRLKDAQLGDPKIRALYSTMDRRINALLVSPNPQEKNLGARQREAVQSATGTTQQADAIAESQVAAKTVSAVVPVKPARVYLQIFIEKDQRAEAIAFREQLRNQAVPVPGVENVGLRLPAGTLPRQQIRYFNDADLAAAGWTQDQLAQAGLGRWDVFKARASRTVPPGQIEVWWSNTRDR